jgi:hypothetical protein
MLGVKVMLGMMMMMMMILVVAAAAVVVADLREKKITKMECLVWFLFQSFHQHFHCRPLFLLFLLLPLLLLLPLVQVKRQMCLSIPAAMSLVGEGVLVTAIVSQLGLKNEDNDNDNDNDRMMANMEMEKEMTYVYSSSFNIEIKIEIKIEIEI